MILENGDVGPCAGGGGGCFVDGQAAMNCGNLGEFAGGILSFGGPMGDFNVIDGAFIGSGDIEDMANGIADPASNDDTESGSDGGDGESESSNNGGSDGGQRPCTDAERNGASACVHADPATVGIEMSDMAIVLSKMQLVHPLVVDPIKPTTITVCTVTTLVGVVCEQVKISLTLPGYNYCGPGNAGGEPTNATDSACRAHDQCYHDGGFSASSNMPGGGSLTPDQVNWRNMCNALLCQDLDQANPSSSGDLEMQQTVTQYFNYTTSGGYQSFCSDSSKMPHPYPPR
jgi:hypothetical protein